jgi:hypothetical protein
MQKYYLLSIFIDSKPQGFPLTTTVKLSSSNIAAKWVTVCYLLPLDAASIEQDQFFSQNKLKPPP